MFPFYGHNNFTVNCSTHINMFSFSTCTLDFMMQIEKTNKKTEVNRREEKATVKKKHAITLKYNYKVGCETARK